MAVASSTVEEAIARNVTRMVGSGWPVGEAILWAIEYYSTEFWWST